KRTLAKLFARKTSSARRRPARPARHLSLESLGDRTLMAASLTASLNTADGVLHVEGTYGNDQIHIRHGIGALTIDRVKISVTDGANTTQAASVPWNRVTRIEVAALDGDDLVQMHDVVRATEPPIPMVVHGASGNDTLIGGLGSDTIFGESGEDSILGGGGGDFLYGDANPDAAQIVQQYGIHVEDYYYNWLGKNEKWLLHKANAGFDDALEFYITPDGGLYQWATYVDGVRIITNNLVEQFDPTHYQDIRSLESERGLYHYDFFYNWGQRNEKWLFGIGDPASDGQYFITPTGELYRWDGNTDWTVPVSGTLIAKLDPSYFSDPYELAKAGTDGADRDVIDGQAGADLIMGGDGNDTLRGGAGNDTVFGGEGSDEIHGGDNDDDLHGEGGNDLIIGENGNDLIHGEAGA